MRCLLVSEAGRARAPERDSPKDPRPLLALLYERANRRLPWRVPLSTAIEPISSPDRAAAEIPAVVQSNPPELGASAVTFSETTSET